ncbi:hypothetical protein J4772_36725 [Cohnella sp. LGH]|uniref:hypothetical protein n=1 Tax=Cohnella sp. LGH TaxID=1619153 RepID=UPI001ADC9CA6|nr:hypothetical protein [Cohnella sp. LGH]QTH42912.1 hypothetical protein J4772_36725 [Cohnella sp. LGH]
MTALDKLQTIRILIVSIVASPNRTRNNAGITVNGREFAFCRAADGLKRILYILNHQKDGCPWDARCQFVQARAFRHSDPTAAAYCRTRRI